MSKPVLKTADEARAELDRQGISIADFARTHGLKPRAIYVVLRGLNVGRRGEAHRAAVALGMKEGVLNPPNA
ncbi:DNA-binding protein [Stenotrophomonas maltophilia]|uniref:DNA-binding protein n=1 Tax=Stenotrophomonas maltophilia TaxID=40324 RepID=UPI0015DDFDCE|nr:DNA-binding protein [Stenotrophomonas maltophilia]MBA0289202.1 DNA-binding protein [Stenotrophomonas maltophilia]NYB77526.1 DNA-binding protein [Stenotrophomonas maltophilia]